MRVSRLLRTATAGAALSLIALAAMAADYPAPKEGDWTIKDFPFHTGDVLPDLRLHYTTIGDPKGEPVVVLHGTTGSAASMLTPASPASCSAPASRSTRRSTSSSCPTRSATADRRSRRMD